jgi:hypothetical protein
MAGIVIVRNAIQDFDERMDAIGQELVHNSTPPFSLADLALSGPSRLPDRLDNGEPVAHHEVLTCPVCHFGPEVVP